MTDKKKPAAPKKKPVTLDQLERLLNSENDWPDDAVIEIMPNGEIRQEGNSTAEERGGRKPLTLRENLGGEYAA